MAPNIKPFSGFSLENSEDDGRIRCAILGCGMVRDETKSLSLSISLLGFSHSCMILEFFCCEYQMGQEHISYILGYSSKIQINFLCDPFEPSLEKAQRIMQEFSGDPLVDNPDPLILTDDNQVSK